MVERIHGWRCIGCGKVDGPRPCIGVCQHRRAELVLAADYDALRTHTEELEAFASLIAHLTPRDGEWEASWRGAAGARAGRAQAALARSAGAAVDGRLTLAGAGCRFPPGDPA